MVTYIKATCRCCGEEIDWTPNKQMAPRCDECRRWCMKLGRNMFGTPIPCRKPVTP